MAANDSPTPLFRRAPVKLRTTASVFLHSAALLATGCAGHRPADTPAPTASVAQLTDPIALPALAAVCRPPESWIAKPTETGPRYTEQVWLSPTGKTAYGVIRIGLPFAAGPDFVLPFFLSEMRKKEGRAQLLEKREDPQLPGLRLVVEGRQHTIRINLMTRGRTAWAVYAGTLRNGPVDTHELDEAERARDSTVPGSPRG